MTPRATRRSTRAAQAALVTAATVLAAASAGLVATLDTPTAAAATVLCDAYARTTTADGRYVVQNNRWGTSATQCIEPTATGFRVTTADGSTSTSGAPKSYPSVYWGCHYADLHPGLRPRPGAPPPRSPPCAPPSR